MRTSGTTAITLGAAALAMMIAAAPAMAGAAPASVAALKAASPTDVVAVGWGHGWGSPLPVTVVGRVPYCGYYPCPLFQPAFIPYAYYGAPYYFGSYDGRLFGYHYRRAFHW